MPRTKLGALASLAGVLLLAGATGSANGAATAPRALTIYSVATGVQYINNADDAARGAGNNPFSTATNKLQPKDTRNETGPFPGDVAVYSFDLYDSSGRGKSEGSASYTCYYNYAKHALCMAYYELSGGRGTLVASGPVDFDNTHFRLVVTGGTKSYLGVTGDMQASTAPRNSQRLQFRLPVQAGSGGSRQKVRSYGVISTAQFMNHADDRVRGMTNNPFNVNTRDLLIITKGKEKGNGPFPGDDVLYSFELYAGSTLKPQNGSAMFTCYFEFVKKATCDAYFQLRDGILLASGPVTFGSTRFTLAVTGGTNRYLGATGQVVAVPGPKKSQRFDFAFD